MPNYISILLLFFSLVGFSQKQDSTVVSLKREIQEASNDSIKIAKLISLSSYQMERVFSEAEYSINQALELAQKIEDKRQLGAVYIQLGVLNRRRSNNVKAVENYHKALNILTPYKDSILISDVYHNLGMAYRYQTNHKKAISYYKKSIVYKERKQDTHGLAASYNMMGVSYRAIKKMDSAMLCYNKAKALFSSISSDEDMRRVNNNMAVIYEVDKKYEQAIALLEENIAHGRKNSKYFSLTTNYYILANIYRKQKKYKDALRVIDSSILIAEEQGFRREISKSYLRKSFIYNKMGNYKGAYDNYRTFNRYSDSIFNIENVKKIQELELNYEFKKQKLADSIQFTKEKQEIAFKAKAESSEKKMFLILFVVTLLATVIISMLIKRGNMEKAKAFTEQIEKEAIQKELLEQKVKGKEEDIKRLVADNSMRLAFKEELLQQLKSKIAKEKHTDSLKQSLESLTRELQFQIATENKSSKLQEKINSVNEGFDARLRSQYPKLTKSEREVCALLRLNLSIKEIMTIRGASVDAIKSVRYRIRKKLELSSKEELEQFVQNI